MARSIVSILPQREGFSSDAFGAIALCVRDFASHSRFDTHVFTGVDKSPFAGIQTHILKPDHQWYEQRTRAYARACIAQINQLQPALVEVHNRPGLLWRLYSHVNAPLALHLHNDPLEMRFFRTAFMRQQLLKRCAAIFCVSQYIKKRFLESIAADHPKVHVVYNGLDPQPPATSKKNQILFVGRLTENKGGLLFAQALQRVLPQLPQWQGMIVGARRHTASSELSDYEKQIAQIMDSLGAQASLLGFCQHEETMRHFRESAIAVIPSLWAEPFGRTALEAMAGGCAVISSGQGGLPEVTAEAAQTPHPFNLESLCATLLSLAQDEQTRTQLQQAARKRAEIFSITACTQRLDLLREGIIR